MALDAVRTHTSSPTLTHTHSHTHTFYMVHSATLSVSVVAVTWCDGMCDEKWADFPAFPHCLRVFFAWSRFGAISLAAIK